MRRPMLVLLSLVTASALVLSACGDDEPTGGAASTDSGAAVTTGSATTPSGCSTEAPEAKEVERTFAQPPPREIDEKATYRVTLKTSCGDIVMVLDPQRGAPNTVNNFVVLAKKDYFDGLTFHRVVTDFVIQGGDPSGDGTGGPGYQFPDELPKTPYKVGDLAMANAGPDTNGSQFFIITGPGGTSLPLAYSRFGRVVKGLDVAKTIEGSTTEPGTERPTPPVYILDVVIEEQ
jgi:cyclophilin family peptidyl-prolyl cis-trans isomerase